MSNPVIDEAERMVFDQMGYALAGQAEATANRLYHVALKLQDDFFKKLTVPGVYMAVNKPGIGGPYPDLSPRWAKRKAKKLGSASGNNFYFGISPQMHKGPHLINVLAKQDASKFFGKPQIEIDTSFIPSNVRLNKSGRYQYVAKTRINGQKVGGQFFKPKIRLSAIAFPDAIGKSDQQLFALMAAKTRDALWLKKLAKNQFGGPLGRWNVPARPLLIPFLSWYVDTHMPSELNRQVSL